MTNGADSAYPNKLASPTNDGYLSTYGLTKREYFAGLAMQGLLAYPRVQEGETPWSQTVALWAIEAADALLAELEKTA